MPAAGYDRQLALRLYIWNIRLCECFYLPVQFAEVAARNAILKPLQKRFKTEWYQNRAFQNLLPPRLLLELNDAVSKERRKHQSALTEGHVVSALSLGFWVALMGASYDKHLWHNGVMTSFPHAAKHQDRAAIHLMLDDMRKLRNDIMHHAAVFDRHPQTRLHNVIAVISLISAHTGDYVTSLSRLNHVINQRPSC